MLQTKRARHATEYAKTVSFDGYDGLVVIGGDGCAAACHESTHSITESRYTHTSKHVCTSRASAHDCVLLGPGRSAR